MRWRVGIGLLVLLALGAVVWLTLGRGSLQRLVGFTRDEAAEERGGLAADGATEPEAPDGATGTRRGPALLGSRRNARAGADGTTDVDEFRLGKPAPLAGMVVDAGGDTVADADIAVHRAPGSTSQSLESGELFDFLANLDHDPEPLARAQTRADGTFRLEVATCGSVVLVVRAPGLRQAFVPLTLLPGVDHGLVRVRLATGGTLAGKAVTEEGLPLGGARIAVYISDDGRSLNLLSRAVTESAADGTFRFTSLPHESYRYLKVVARADRYPDVYALAQVGAADFVLTFRRGATLAVKVLGGEPAVPIAGARVVVTVGDERGPLDAPSPRVLAGGVTDAEGLALLDVRPGRLRMAIVSVPGAPSERWFSPQDEQWRSTGMIGPSDLVVPAGRTRIEFRVTGGARVFGRVTDLDGRGLGGVEVFTLGGGPQTVSAADGSYDLRMSTLPSFGTELRARLRGWVLKDLVESVVVGEAPDARPSPPANALPPSAERRVTLRMRRGAAVAGRVLDLQGRPLPGATVIIDGSGSDVSSLTLADGKYVLEGVAPEREVRVVASREGFVASASQKFTVGADGVTTAPDVRLSAGATVTLRVLDPWGQPVRDARVQVEAARADGIASSEGESGPREFRTGPSGAVEVTGLPPCALTLRVFAAGYAPSGAQARIADGGGPAEPLTVRLTEGVTLAGRVVDEEGHPLADVVVRITNRYRHDAAWRNACGGGGRARAEADDESADSQWSEDEWSASRSATTDEHGRWTVRDLPHRRLQVEATRAGYYHRSQDVGAERADIEVRLVKWTTRVAEPCAEDEDR